MTYQNKMEWQRAVYKSEFKSLTIRKTARSIAVYSGSKLVGIFDLLKNKGVICA